MEFVKNLACTRHDTDNINGTRKGSQICRMLYDNTEHYIGFALKDAFNGDITRWDTSHYRYEQYVLRNVDANKPIGSWDTSRVSNMKLMLGNASAFNQDLWDWSTSNTKYEQMSLMLSCLIKISTRDTSAVTNMDSCFKTHSHTLIIPCTDSNSGPPNSCTWIKGACFITDTIFTITQLPGRISEDGLCGTGNKRQLWRDA